MRWLKGRRGRFLLALDRRVAELEGNRLDTTRLLELAEGKVGELHERLRELETEAERVKDAARQAGRA